MTKSLSKTVIITSGDPAGIGAEIISKLFFHRKILELKIAVIGRTIFYEQILNKLSLKDFLHPVKDASHVEKGKLNLIEPDEPCEVSAPVKPSPASGREALRYIDKAVEMIKTGASKILITAPVSKKNIADNLKGFSGHTYYLADKFGISRDGVVMMIISRTLRVALLSQHVPINKVSGLVKKERIVAIVEKIVPVLEKFGFVPPRIAVAALNPHSGEGGYVGSEEINEIYPAVLELKKKGFDVAGPINSEICFMEALKNKFDAVVSMYHDQGIVPVKILSHNKAVNFTVGLPFVRVSPLHGTAFDIAGKFKAREDSMLEAVEFASAFSRK